MPNKKSGPGKKDTGPSNAVVLKAFKNVSTFAEGAKKLGTSPSTVRGWLSMRNLDDDVKTMIAETKERLREQAIVENPSGIDPRETKIERLQAEVSLLRKENKTYKTHLANQEEFFDRIVEVTKVPVEKPNYKKAKVKSKKTPRSVVTPIFDIQFGQLVKPSDTPFGIGEYNVEIFKQRLQRWVETVSATLVQWSDSHPIDELDIVLGGDLTEGYSIFRGQEWQLELHPIKQVWVLANLLTPALQEVIRVAKEQAGVKYIVLYSVPGNHGKVGGKMSGATPADFSWDVLVSEIMFDKLRSEPIDLKAIEPAGALIFETASHTFLTIHGDEVKGWGGLPFYGLSKFDGKSVRLAQTPINYTLLGHHHQQGVIPNGSGGEFLVSGDWVGANNLSRHIVDASRPQQRMFSVSPKWGIVDYKNIAFVKTDERPLPHIYTPKSK